MRTSRPAAARPNHTMAADTNKSAARRSDSFHSANTTPVPSPSPPPPFPPAPRPLLLLPPPPPLSYPLPPEKSGPLVEGVEEAAFRRILKRSKEKERLRIASYGFRVSQAVLCLVSLAVMAADRTRGWSGDSFYRYREYRFCLSVNVIGFLFSGFQLYDLAYRALSGKHFLAYLLMSASSAAATRVDDWESNWGKDQFTKMASTSIGAAFVAFLSFALCSLISGYNLCTRDFA